MVVEAGDDDSGSDVCLASSSGFRLVSSESSPDCLASVVFEEETDSPLGALVAVWVSVEGKVLSGVSVEGEVLSGVSVEGEVLSAVSVVDVVVVVVESLLSFFGAGAVSDSGIISS